VIGQDVVDRLFEPEDPIGKYIKINGVYFQVIGVSKKKSSAEMGDNPDAKIYVPFTTFQKAFNSLNEVHWFTIVAKPGIDVGAIEKEIKRADGPQAQGGPHGRERLRQLEHAGVLQQHERPLHRHQRAISWFVGICTLLAGAIGIGNIMLMSIKERTKEIGIRRSIGATPRMITGQIVQEALTLTFIAGYFGLLAGVGVLEAMRSVAWATRTSSRTPAWTSSWPWWPSVCSSWPDLSPDCSPPAVHSPSKPLMPCALNDPLPHATDNRPLTTANGHPSTDLTTENRQLPSNHEKDPQVPPLHRPRPCCSSGPCTSSMRRAPASPTSSPWRSCARTTW
jgi:hypothetical protein